jgi:hypothetical protein
MTQYIRYCDVKQKLSGGTLSGVIRFKQVVWRFMDLGNTVYNTIYAMAQLDG